VTAPDEQPPARSLSRTARALIVALAGAFSIIVIAFDVWHNPSGPTDFDQIWYAAKAVRAGLDPYVVIGPTGSMFHWDFPFYYPMTAVVVVMPFSFLPLIAARMAFAAISSALLAYGIVSRGPLWRLLIFASAPFLMASGSGQWTVLLTASLLIPALGVVYPAKPNLGAAYFVGQSHLRPRLWITAWLLIGATSFLVGGMWLPSWLAAVRTAPHFRPYVMHLGGPLLLLALLRWRRPEARLLAALAVVPHTTMIYETLPILLMAERRIECMGLVLLGGIAFVMQHLYVHGPDDATYIWKFGNVTLWLMYFPALVMILRRPNEGSVVRP
jgi:hypothetical protein